MAAEAKPYPRDVVLVEFPFSDMTGSKLRPAVVVSSPSYPDCENEVIVLMITSQIERAACETDCPLWDWQDAGLKTVSAVRCRPATIRIERVKSRLGRLSEQDWQQVRECLRRAFEL